MDCSKTENYFKEKVRMIKADTHAYCRIDCRTCSLCSENNGTGIDCTKLELLYPQKAIEIVQRWSDEHPQKTYLSEFLKHYPKAQLDKYGLPIDICLCKLGLGEDCGGEGDCTQCWNTPIEEDN